MSRNSETNESCKKLGQTSQEPAQHKPALDVGEHEKKKKRLESDQNTAPRHGTVSGSYRGH